MDLALNNQKWLICHKIKPNQTQSISWTTQKHMCMIWCNLYTRVEVLFMTEFSSTGSKILGFRYINKSMLKEKPWLLKAYISYILPSYHVRWLHNPLIPLSPEGHTAYSVPLLFRQTSYIWICASAYIWVYMHIFMCVYECIYNVSISECVSVFICVWVYKLRMWLCVYILIYIESMWYISIYIYIYIYREREREVCFGLLGFMAYQPL